MKVVLDGREYSSITEILERVKAQNPKPSRTRAVTIIEVDAGTRDKRIVEYDNSVLASETIFEGFTIFSSRGRTPRQLLSYLLRRDFTRYLAEDSGPRTWLALRTNEIPDGIDLSSWVDDVLAKRYNSWERYLAGQDLKNHPEYLTPEAQEINKAVNEDIEVYDVRSLFE